MINQELAQKSAIEMVGDNKLPNHYWVSIGNDYLYFDGESYEGTDNLKLFESKGKTIARFDTYAQAKQFADDDLSLGSDYDGIRINGVQIEDRLSGELFNRCYAYHPATAEMTTWETEDTRYTENEMAKRGVNFK